MPSPNPSVRSASLQIEGVKLIPEMDYLPFIGGVDTARSIYQLPLANYSDLQNMRNKHPGLMKRKGMLKLHSTADSTNKVMSLYQFVKGKKTERHLYAQMSDSDVLEATNNPPTITTGVFGSEVFSGSASPLPASWTNVNDLLLFCNGVDLPQIYPGTASPVSMFIVYKGAAAIPTIPELGDDYTLEVTDGNTSTIAVLNDLGALAAYDCIFVMTPVPIDGLNFTISAPNGTVSAAGCNYWNGSAWTTVGTVGDTTKGTNTTLSVDGLWSWTLPTAHVSSYMYGVCGYWYQLHVSVALDAAVSVSAVTYESDWQAIQNVWDGIPVSAIEVQIYDTSTTGYRIYGSSSVDMIGSVGGDILYVASTDPCCAIMIDVGTTPVVSGADIATVTFWNGSAWTAVTGLVDGTNGLEQSGWITFARQTTIQKYRLNESVFYAYWYAITLPNANAAICLNFNGDDAATTFTDISGKTWTASGGAQLDTAQKKYGTASLLLDGTDDSISTPSHADFNVGTGDFTIECWIRSAAFGSASNYVIASGYQSSSNYWAWVFIGNGSNQLGNINFYCYINSSIVINFQSGPAVATALNTWTHLAIVRKSGSITLFQDGVSVYTDTTGCDGNLWYSSPFVIGECTGLLAYNGWIDDFRFHTSAIYTANFTVPTEFDGTITGSSMPSGMSISADTEPYFDITEIGKGQTVASWKGRAIYGTDQDHYVYLSAVNNPQVLNGSDYAILDPGDGRYNRPVAMRNFKDDLIIWQEEKGKEGGCITKYSWITQLSDIKKTIISTTLGTMNAKSVDIVDGVIFEELNRDISVMTLAFFLSRTGVYITDGNVCYNISQKIGNYFDPIKDECIRRGYEAEMWLKYDSTYNVIRVGLVSGSSASVPNIFPVYDIQTKTWGFDTLGQELSCIVDIEAESGNDIILQVGGGTDDGTVHFLNYGTNDNSTAISGSVTMEFDGGGHDLHLEQLVLRLSGTCSLIPYADGVEKNTIDI